MQYPQDYLSIIYQRSRYYVDLTKEDWYCEELNQHILMLTQNGFAYALAIFEIEINMFCVNYDFDRIMVDTDNFIERIIRRLMVFVLIETQLKKESLKPRFSHPWCLLAHEILTREAEKFQSVLTLAK